MPVPLITPKLIASSRPIELGWSLLVLDGPPRSEKSRDGESVNYFFDFTAELGPGNSDVNKGRSTTYMVSGKALDGGIREVCTVYLQLMSALTGLSAEELTNQDINENALVGKKVWADISERFVDGKAYKEFKAFAPSNVIPF